MVNLLYLAKPTYGGWVTFNSYLAKINDTHIYKITKRTERKFREYGYGVKYQNITISDFMELDGEIVITALDKNFINLLSDFTKKVTIVIHDPTEFKSNKDVIIPFLKKNRVITIRESVKELLDKLGVNNIFKNHPYILDPDVTINKKKNRAVSISRIDYDKNTNIILEANKHLDKPIDIYGAKNDRYVYFKLKNIDSMREDDPESCYKGKFGKDQGALNNILCDKKFVVDLSSIKGDGGGSQYTFLEAIQYGCVLILNKKWLINNSIFIDGVNCLAVENTQELVNILTRIPSEEKLKTININAKRLLDEFINIDQWIF